MEQKRISFSQQLLLNGLIAMSLSWFACAFLDSILYSSNSLWQHFFSPPPREILSRLLIIILQLIMIAYAWIVIQRSKHRAENGKVSLNALAMDDKNITRFKSGIEPTTLGMPTVNLKTQLNAIESSIDGIAILDSNGHFIFMNKSHAGIYGGKSPVDFIGKSWHILYEEREALRIEREIFPLLNKYGHWRGEGIGLKMSGELFPQEISLTLVDEGMLTCVVRDITDRKTAEAKIHQLNESLQQQAQVYEACNKELETFSYSLSHDLNTPLSRIYVAAQGLEEMYASQMDETGRYLMRSICEGSEQIEELINSMLVLSKVTREELNHLDIDLSKLAGDIVTELRSVEPDRQVEAIIQPAVTCSGDPNLLRVAIKNLLENAWKYTRKTAAPTLEFGMINKNGTSEYYVRDNGAGFDMELADDLFKPFKRLHKIDEFAGNGIGLATVKRIIERHGGHIRGIGEPGKGATIFFTLGNSTQTSPFTPTGQDNNQANANAT